MTGHARASALSDNFFILFLKCPEAADSSLLDHSGVFPIPMYDIIRRKVRCPEISRSGGLFVLRAHFTVTALFLNSNVQQCHQKVPY